MDRIVARRALLAAVAVGISAQALIVSLAIGVNLVVLTALVLFVAALFARAAGVRTDPVDAWIPVAALLVAVGTALRSDDMLVFLDSVTAAVLLGASVAAFAGAQVTKQSAARLVSLGTHVLAWSAGGVLRLTYLARRPEPTDTPHRPIPPAARAVARGLAIALPLLLLFALLFASADAIFASVAERLFDWQVDLGEVPFRLAVAFIVAWPVAGLLAVATGAADPFVVDGPAATRGAGRPPMQSLGAAVATVPPAHALSRLGATEAVTILVAIDALFVVFVGLQVAYLFGGLDTMAAGGITYANYARRGFFELVAVTCVSGGLIVGLNAVVAERTRSFIAAAVVLAGLTAVVLASAAFRMGLYQDAYGWTELRFYIAATICWLGIGIAAAVVLLARDRMRWLIHAMTIGALVVLAAVNAIGPQRYVAEANVARLLNPALVPPDGRQGLDLDYVLTLGHDADPALVAALPALEPPDGEWLISDLETRWIDLARPENIGWPAWNLARTRAEAALDPLFARR